MTEIVRIGDATLYHGDCREILPTLEKVDLVLTDPPYGMDFRSNHRAEKHLRIEGDDSADVANFAIAWGLENALVASYFFGRWDNVADYPKPKSLITWIKNNWSMGDLYHEHARQTEVAFFYPGPCHAFAGSRPTDVVYAQRTDNGNHPTEKPVSLMAAFLGFASGSVIDPFMGSGTTGVACAQIGRTFTGIERERKYFDIACERIERAYAQGQLFDPSPMNAYEKTDRQASLLEVGK